MLTYIISIIKINTVGFANRFKAGIIYTYKTAFIGSFVNNTLIINNLDNVNYNNVYTSVNVLLVGFFQPKFKKVACSIAFKEYQIY